MFAFFNNNDPKFQQFLCDYWLEMKKHCAVIGLLADCHFLTPPEDLKFRRRPILRCYDILITGFLCTGMTSLLNCSFSWSKNDLEQQHIACTILTLIIVTIPLEIFHFIWFRWVSNRSALLQRIKSTKFAPMKVFWCGFQCTGTVLGIAWGLIVLIITVIVFTISSLTNRYCNQEERLFFMLEVLFLQFFLTPLFMCLPYWRQQGKILCFLGHVGPVVGLFLHYRKYGCAPPPSSSAEEEKEGKEEQRMEGMEEEGGIETSPKSKEMVAVEDNPIHS